MNPMPTLYGPDDRPIAKTIQHPRGDDETISANKGFVEKWLPVATKGDSDLGRGDHNWAAPPRKFLTQEMVDSLRARGIVLYLAPGQIILADLTGRNPRIRQRRPLAERYIELKQEIEH